ncbi:hypothetical protein [Candidatus Spongiihabitans sp.]|uniref:hypothetical protein n=1 Tax=Candidatus Spongiihabitans sp. TaxID=3101308 RepID=UPI003C6FB58F
MLSVDNVHKLKRMAVARGSSVAEVIRVAVDTYNNRDIERVETHILNVDKRLVRVETFAEVAKF